jgi:hypothetical protein
MYMNLCPYKYILGVPGKGIHKYRYFGISIVDTIMTIIGAVLLAYLFTPLHISNADFGA